jgi:hypothetical protein
VYVSSSMYCQEGSGSAVDVTSEGGGGGTYTLENNYGEPVIVVVQTTDGRSQCEQDVYWIGRDSSLKVISYF